MVEDDLSSWPFLQHLGSERFSQWSVSVQRPICRGTTSCRKTTLRCTGLQILKIAAYLAWLEMVTWRSTFLSVWCLSIKKHLLSIFIQGIYLGQQNSLNWFLAQKAGAWTWDGPAPTYNTPEIKYISVKAFSDWLECQKEICKLIFCNTCDEIERADPGTRVTTFRACVGMWHIKDHRCHWTRYCFFWSTIMLGCVSCYACQWFLFLPSFLPFPSLPFPSLPSFLPSFLLRSFLVPSSFLIRSFFPSFLSSSWVSSFSW